MKNNCLVSIITPCHNAANVIGQTIDSVLAQDYQDWEMLITDDGSTDNSVEVVEAYAAKDNRIKLFRLENASGSPAAPRNHSIEHASGKYIAFLDSDDIWEPKKLSEQVAFAEEYNHAIVYSYYEKMSFSGERSNRVVKTADSYNYKDLLRTDGIPWLTLLVRRDILDGVLFVKDNKEDYIYLLRLLRKGYTAFNTKQVHALYREALDSRSGNKFKMLYGQWIVLRKYESLSFWKSLYCVTIYGVQGLKKYFI